jgi:hypothetical protein
MPKPCGKAVHDTRIKSGKTLGQLSTVIRTAITTYIRDRVKARVSPKVIRTFPQTYSPLKIAVPPLIEHYFYPVSTGPTNTDTK